MAEIVALCRSLTGGAIATVVHWLVMALLVWSGTEPVIATLAGAAVGAAGNYQLQFNFTFQARAAHRTAIPRYLLAMVVGWLANGFLFFLLHINASLPAPAAQVLTSVIVAFLNYLLYSRFVFHEQSRAT